MSSKTKKTIMGEEAVAILHKTFTKKGLSNLLFSCHSTDKYFVWHMATTDPTKTYLKEDSNGKREWRHLNDEENRILEEKNKRQGVSNRFELANKLKEAFNDVQVRISSDKWRGEHGHVGLFVKRPDEDIIKELEANIAKLKK